MQFRLLGSVEVTAGDTQVKVTGKPLALLAVLLLHANSAVSLNTIVDALWSEDDLPAEARAAVQTCVMRLRRALGSDAVETVGSGYRMTATADTLDLLRFADLTRRAGDLAARGDHVGTARLLREAIELWRGPALLDVPAPALRRDQVPALTERFLHAWEAWADAELAVGRLPVAELTRLTGEHPLRERFWAQLMLALHRSGRTADALEAYRRVADALADQLGLDPGPALRQTHQAILTGSAELDPTGPDTGGPEPADAPAVVPRELSATPDTFVGREDELGRLASLAAVSTSSVVTVVAVEGTAGVGKTTIGVRFANDHADAFRDGQLQLNLHGYGSDEPVAPGDALESLLGSLGVSGRQLPAALDARSALWRTKTAGRRLVILLDNARSSEQVRPLLPGPGCFVLVTSRAQLRSLAAREGAHRIAVDRLDEDAALALLSRGVGGDRVVNDLPAARRLVTYCARLPLAIRIVGEHANQRPDLTLTQFAVDLDDKSDRLDAFDLDDGVDTDLRALFDHSYAALESDTATMFRRLGVIPGLTLGVAEAAAASGLPTSGARRLVDRLVGAHLLETSRRGRFEFHDLLREYAAELARRADDAPVVLRRLVDWYLFAGLRAADALGDSWVNDVAEPPGLHLPDFGGFEAGWTWFDEHRGNIVAAVAAAHEAGLHWHAAQLALVLRRFLNNAQVQEGWVASCRIGIDAARAIGDRRTEGRLLTGLGLAQTIFGHGGHGLDSNREALAIAEEVGRPEDEFAALTNLQVALISRGDVQEAVPYCRRALAVAQDANLRRQTVKAHSNLSDLLMLLGDHEEARHQAETALELCGPENDPLGWAIATLNLATAQAATGRRPAAIAGYRVAARRFRELHQPVAEAEAHERLGDLYRDEGDEERGLAHLRTAHDLLATTGHIEAARVAAKLRDVSAAISPSA